MANISIISYSPDDLHKVVNALLEKHAGKRVFAFYGQMGAGKTTFIREMCRHLKVIDNVASPTFSIINEYKTETQGNVFHFDFYRLSQPSEAAAIGTEEYLFSGDYCLVEWPEIIEPLLPQHAIKVWINVDESGRNREFTF